MIQVSDVAKQYGPQVLFRGVTARLNPGERYGLVGANGAGKTTFLKMLTGDEEPDAGDITMQSGLRLGVLRQDQFQGDDDKIVHVAMAGQADVLEALKELDEHADDADPARVTKLTELVLRKDGYTLEARSREILQGLGIPSEQIDEPLSVLSGGFKLRVLLAQVLVSQPEVLLLDEPTNHLDIVSIAWLEDFLRSFSGCVVVISHDRRFLDGITTRILDVDFQTISDYAGNYTQFLEAKELRLSQNEAEAERAEKIIAEKRAFVERFRAKATKARQAQSRIKQIEKIDVPDVIRTTRRAPHFAFQQHRPTGKDVLAIKGIEKRYGSLSVLSDVSFEVKRGEKLAVIGPNGIGKSTLIKILAGAVAADAGTIDWGVHARVDYFAQDHHELLDDAKMTPLDFVYNAVPQQTTSYVRGQLGRMLFSGDEVEKSIGALSGGEAARLIFTRLTVQEPNVLLLDEPTNHLDIEAIEALAEALRTFAGTVLFVSHDRWFVSEVASRIVELKPEGLSDFSGTYDEYLERSGADHLDHAATLEAVNSGRQARAVSPPKAPEATHEERRRRANLRKSLPKKRDEVLAKIERLESEKAQIHSRYEDPRLFEPTAEDELKSLRQRETQIDEEIEPLMQSWEELETEIARLDSEA